MSAEEALWPALIAWKRELTGENAVGLSSEDVVAIRAATIDRWRAKPKGAFDAARFFASLRTVFGPLSQKQVDGYNRLLTAMGAAAWPLAFAAYGLTTSRHETADNLAPVEEAYWKDDAWRKKNLRYYPWHGRGDVQLTWERNYKRADTELGLGGRLVADPRLALDPEISAKVLVRGMEQGWFTGKKLADYLPSSGPADIHQFANARRIINGLDKAVPIAEVALKMQAALEAGGWA
jgi:putative chitinase